MSKPPAFVPLFLALFLLAGCGGGGSHGSVSSGDPNFVVYPDAVPGQYIATYAKGAYRETTDTDPGDGTQIATAICEKYGATLNEAFTYAGSFSFASTEKQARTMSHDSRVDVVEEDAVVTAAAKKR